MHGEQMFSLVDQKNLGYMCMLWKASWYYLLHFVDICRISVMFFESKSKTRTQLLIIMQSTDKEPSTRK